MINKDLKYEDIQRLAISSRIVVFCLQIFASELVPPHVNDGFKFVDDEAKGILDRIINYLFGGMTNWDGQYFLHITKYGFSSTVILASFFLNTFIFVKSAQLLYRLSPYLDRGLNSLSTLTVILFCFNPASIFFSAFYTETLFVYLTLQVLLSLYQKKKVQAVFYASLSSVCRSNGVLNFGFCLAFSLRGALRRVDKDN
ncbi:unnamed protein product, partial [Allacma fusca]